MIDARDPGRFSPRCSSLAPRPVPLFVPLVSSLLIKLLRFTAGQLAISFTIRVTDVPVYP